MSTHEHGQSKVGAGARMPPMPGPSEATLRRLHQSATKYVYGGERGEYERQHEDEVVAEAQRFLRGERDEPWKHSHWCDEFTGESEQGYCVECDAAHLLELLEDADA